MSTSQNHYHWYSIIKPKPFLLTKQIFSSKVATVTSKREAQAILNSGADMMFLNLTTQYCQNLKVNSSCEDMSERSQRMLRFAGCVSGLGS